MKLFMLVLSLLCLALNSEAATAEWSCAITDHSGGKKVQELEVERDDNGPQGAGSFEVDGLQVRYESGLGGYGEQGVEKYSFEVIEVSSLGRKEAELEVDGRNQFSLALQQHPRFSRLTCSRL